MSHFTTVKTQMKNKGALLQSLHDLKLEGIKENAQGRGYRGDKRQAEIVCQSPKRADYDILFDQDSEGNYGMTADWSMMGGSSYEKEFRNMVNQRYSFNVVMEQAQTQGFTLTEETTSQQGEIRLVLSKY